MQFPVIKLHKSWTLVHSPSHGRGAGKVLLFFILCYIVTSSVLKCFLNYGYFSHSFNNESGCSAINTILFKNTDINRGVVKLGNLEVSHFHPASFILTSIAVGSQASSFLSKSTFPLIFSVVFSTSFQGGYSRSLPRTEKLKRIYTLFKGLVGGVANNATSLNLPQNPAKPEKRRKSKSYKHFQQNSKGFEDDEVEQGNWKSKRISLSNIIPASGKDDAATYGDSNPADNPIQGGIGNILTEDHITSVLNSLYKNLAKLEQDFIGKKSNRFGKNDEQLKSLLFSLAGSKENESRSRRGGRGSLLKDSEGSSSKFKSDEEEALRRNILEKVEELDPLMCLPKVLCGYSSRQQRRHKDNYYSEQKPTKSTGKPKKKQQTGLLQDYLELLKFFRPSTTKPPSKPKSKKKAKKKKKKTKPFSVNILNDEEDVENNDEFHSRSGSESSSESNESSPDYNDIPYEKYPIRRPESSPSSYPHKRPSPRVEKKKEQPQSEFHKFLFGVKKKKKDKDEDENDEENGDVEENEEGQEEDEGLDDLVTDELFDDDDMAYFMEKERMNKLMSSSGKHSGENWWEPFDASQELKLMYPAYKYPMIAGPSPASSFYDPLNTDSDFISQNEGLTGWLTNMVGNIMPKFAWGGWGNGVDEFKNDPFFTSFDRSSTGRSLKNSDWSTRQRSLIGDYVLSNKTMQGKRNRSGRRLDLGKLLGMENSMGEIDLAKLGITEPTTKESEDIEKEKDPAEKFRVAVELGKRVSSPGQCDFIYNGCPLSYEEILLVINEPMKQSYQTTTTRKPTPVPFVRNKGSNFVYPTQQNHIATPQYITMPLYTASSTAPQQLQTYYVYPTQQQQQTLSPYQSQRFPQRGTTHLYNQNFQKHHQQEGLHYIHQNQPNHYYHPQQQEFHQQNKLDEFMAQVVGIDGNPGGTSSSSSKHNHHRHQTRIQQALPSGEQFEINLLYSDKNGNGIEIVDRSGLTASSGSQESFGGGVADKAMINDVDPLNHKTLQYPHYQFSSVNNRYKLQKKSNIPTLPEKAGEEDDEREIWKGDLDSIGKNKINNSSVPEEPLTNSSIGANNLLSSTLFVESNKNETETGTSKLTPFSEAERKEINTTVSSTPASLPPKDVFNKLAKKKEKLNKYKEMLKGAITSAISAQSKPSPRPNSKSPSSLSYSFPSNSNRISFPILKNKSKKSKEPRIRIPLSSPVKHKKHKKISKVDKKNKGFLQKNDANVDDSMLLGRSNEEDNGSSDSNTESNISNVSGNNNGESSSISSSSSTSKEDKISRSGKKRHEEKRKTPSNKKSNRMSSKSKSRLEEKESGKMKENKLNLHKQSSKSSEAKKGLNRRKTKKAGFTSSSSAGNNKNRIYSTYEDPYYLPPAPPPPPPPPPYTGGYFHRLPLQLPPTTTVASFLSYWFG